MTTSHPPRVAIVGDQSATVQAHTRIPGILATGEPGSVAIEPYWLQTDRIEGPQDLAGFDGVWVSPGSPYRSMDGVLVAIGAARVGGIPLLGTCGGFQHLVVEYARSVCGLAGVDHAEVHPDAAELVISPLACSLFGEEEEVVVRPGTLAAAAMGAGPSTERFFCRYGINEAYLGTLVAHGLVVSGTDGDGATRLVEITDHPWFVGALFQPELASDATWVHPLIRSFAAAARRHAGHAAPAPRWDPTKKLRLGVA